MYGDDDRDSDYEDTENEIFSPSFKPSYVVVAIDAHPSMFKNNANGTMPFRMCLEACQNVAETLLFRKDSRSWSPFAVIIAGASTPLISFSESVLELIKLLKIKSKLTDDDLIKEYQRKGNLDLSSFFLTCKKLFHAAAKTDFYKRTLLYLSNDDKPISDKNSKFTALNEIKTFIGSQIQFQIVPTVPSFNYKLFYNELFSILDGLRQEEICTDSEGLTQKLSSTILLNINQRKVLFYPFKDDTTRFLKCLRLSIYSNIQLYNTIMTKDGQKLSNTSVPSDTQIYFRIKNVTDKASNVKFDPVEKDSLMDSTTPKGLILMYVADRQVGIGHIFTSPNLIRADPKEELPYFSKFWDNCVATNKVLVCISKVRQPDKIRCAELIPVLVDGIQMFLEKRLPFGNEIVLPQKLDYPVPEVNEERKKIVQKLVEKLTFDFDPKLIVDIPFQKKKAYIRAKLLDEPIEPVFDNQVDRQALDSVLEDVIAEIKEKFELTEVEKKKRASRFYGNKNKKMK